MNDDAVLVSLLRVVNKNVCTIEGIRMLVALLAQLELHYVTALIFHNELPIPLTVAR